MRVGMLLRASTRAGSAGRPEVSVRPRRAWRQTLDVAHALGATEDSPSLRFVIEDAGKVIAYFILEPAISVHEADRYGRLGITLKSGRDYMFAASVLDAYQNNGIASLAMPHLIAVAQQSGARSLVLIGGTQATNTRAIAFHGKFGFDRFGGYQTEIFNHDMRLIIEA